MPDYNHVHIEWPDLENATLAELKVFLPNILRITLAPGSNLKAHKDAYSSWMSQNHVCLFGATEYDPAWIACASNERINAMLQVYFPESRKF